MLELSTNSNKVSVLIESDWNLKNIQTVQAQCVYEVLIESDWNLKQNLHFVPFCQGQY